MEIQGVAPRRARDVALATGRIRALLEAAGAEAERVGLESAEEAILAAVAEEGALGKVGRRFGVTRAAVQAWIRTDPERLRPMIEKARLEAGEARAEQAGEHFEDLGALGDITREEIALAKERSAYDRWLAGVWNRQYKDQGANVVVALDLGRLHLDALRAEGVRRTPVAVAEAIAPGEDGGRVLEVEPEAWEDE